MDDDNPYEKKQEPSRKKIRLYVNPQPRDELEESIHNHVSHLERIIKHPDDYSRMHIMAMHDHGLTDDEHKERLRRSFHVKARWAKG